MAIFGMVWMVLCVASVSLAQDYQMQVQGDGQGVAYATMNNPYAGAAPSGMRFGDAPQVVEMQTGDYGGYRFGAGPCDSCGGVGACGSGNCCLNCGPRICDPCWCGPCMDWKQIGWYSCFKNCHEKNHCCRRACCCPCQ
ncbi:MAG: hypothetical protein DWQ37_08410 [Planctomycetota bacterium]|nr:MAG: hypothetical protein DWQ37_08410 [Planctomycetota bacterium]